MHHERAAQATEWAIGVSAPALDIGPSRLRSQPRGDGCAAEVCRTWGELERLEKAVRALPDLVVAGSMGQPRMHPLLDAVRAHRALLAKLCEQLNLPDVTQEVGLRPGQKRAQHAARARWDGRGSAAS
jgi:hypothetical protein